MGAKMNRQRREHQLAQLVALRQLREDRARTALMKCHANFMQTEQVCLETEACLVALRDDLPFRYDAYLDQARKVQKPRDQMAHLAANLRQDNQSMAERAALLAEAKSASEKAVLALSEAQGLYQQAMHRHQATQEITQKVRKAAGRRAALRDEDRTAEESRNMRKGGAR
jgi:hypothetical protein